MAHHANEAQIINNIGDDIRRVLRINFINHQPTPIPYFNAYSIGSPCGLTE